MQTPTAKLLLIGPERLCGELAGRLSSAETFVAVHTRSPDLSGARADRKVAKIIAETEPSVIGYLGSGGTPRLPVGGEPPEGQAARACARGITLAQRHGAVIDRLVVLSWTAVYGVARSGPLIFSESFVDLPDEPDPASTVGLWSEGLREAETTFAEAAAKIGASLCLLRSAPVVGGPVDSIVSDFLAARFPMRVAGYDPPFQVIHYSDFVAALQAALVQNESVVLNIAGRGVVRLSRMAALCGVLAAPMPAAVVSRFAPSAPGLARLRYRCVADTRRMAQVLGVRPRYGAEDAVRNITF